MASRLGKYIKHFGLKDGLTFYKTVKKSKESCASFSFLQHPVFFRGNYSDQTMFQQIFLEHQYNFPLKFAPTTIIDLGANVGFGSLYFANKFKQAKIFAVEPEKNNYTQALKNTKPYSNITLVQGAVWYKPDSIKIVDNGFGEAGFMVETGVGENSVRAYTINEIMDLMATNTIDLLKIDVEGTEKELFENNYENWIPKIKVIVVETHDRYKKGTSKAIFNTISKYNFSLEISGENLVLYNNDLLADY